MAPGEQASVELRLARILETPLLARVVPHLPPEALHQIIRYRGLDACGELVTSATPAQLTAVLDLDLFRHTRPGSDDRFDVDRFGEWLEVLVENGDSAAARTLAALDENLVVAGLSRYVRVFDPGIFEPVAQSDDEPADRHEAMREGDSLDLDEDLHMHNASDGGLECEVGGYLVRARRATAWDAIVALLVTLAEEHRRFFHAVMQRCRRLSNSRSEIDGLDDLLQAPEQHLHAVTLERERRRSQQGYATPAEARAFLAMARQKKNSRSQPSANAGSPEVNPIVAAYFRATGEAPVSPVENTHTTDTRESVEAVIDLLTEAGVMPERPRARLGAADDGPQPVSGAGLPRLMAFMRDMDESAYFARSRELAFLANTLLAGGSLQSRPFTPQEASDAAAGVCNLGLEYWRSDSLPPDLVTAFEMGWSVLHHDVSLFAADQLVAMLRDIDCADRELRRGLFEFRRTLVKQCEAGAPWRARAAADPLSIIDMTAWISVLGLLDECPVLPAALTAVVKGSTTPVSPTAFDFISTAAQIGDVRRFLWKLPSLLSIDDGGFNEFRRGRDGRRPRSAH